MRSISATFSTEESGCKNNENYTETANIPAEIKNKGSDRKD